VCESLQQTLVELAALASHTKQAHWNISGPNFMSVHLYLDQLTDVLRQRFDDVGERIAALGGSPDARPITVSESTTLSSIPAGPLDVGSALGAIEANLTSSPRPSVRVLRPTPTPSAWTSTRPCSTTSRNTAGS
jgi:starvation-inducible DNA-binding protein